MDSALRQKAAGALLLILLAAAVFLPYLDRLPWAHEEPRRAIVAQEMILTGQHVQPTVCQRPYSKKPPLHNWAIALAAGRDGVVRPGEARAVSLAAFLLLGGAVYLLVRREMPGAAPAALLATLTNYLMAGEYSRLAEPDMLFALLTFLAYFIYMRDPARLPALALSSLCLGSAILVKGVAPLFFYPGLILYAALRAPDRRRRLLRLALHAAMALIPPLLWAAALAGEGRLEPMLAVVAAEVAGKATGSLGAHARHLAEFPLRLFAVLLPWPALLIAARRPAPARGALYWTSLYAAAIAFALFLLAPGARERYLLPAVPYFAIVTAHHFDARRLVPRAAAGAWIAVTALAGIAAGAFLLARGIVPQALILFVAATAAAAIARRRLRWLELGLVTAGVLLLVHTHGVLFYRTTYRPATLPAARALAGEIRPGLPVLIEPRAGLLGLAVDLEGLIGRPLHDRDAFDFDEHYLITDRDHLDGRGRLILRLPPVRRGGGEVVLQEIRDRDARGARLAFPFPNEHSRLERRAGRDLRLQRESRSEEAVYEGGEGL